MRRSEQEIIADVAANEFELKDARTALVNNPKDKGAKAQIDSLVMRQDELRKEMKVRSISVDAGNVSSTLQDLAERGPDMSRMDQQIESLSQNAPRFQKRSKPSALQNVFAAVKDFFVGIYNGIKGLLNNVFKRAV